MASMCLVAGCGTIIAGPGETIRVAPLATEDLADSCQFDMNLPDSPLQKAGQSPATTAPIPTEVATLVIYERGDSADLFNDNQVQQMAASLHLVTVFAHQCNAKSFDDIQPDASKGPGRALFAALSTYATDTGHPEIATNKVIPFGFSAAGVLSVTLASTFPERVLTVIPYASGSAHFDLDTVSVTAAMTRIPTLVLANAYDSQSGDQRSYRFFKKGATIGAPWNLGVQNHTDHCCTLSVRNVMIPWITALVPPSSVTAVTSAASSVRYSTTVPVTPVVSFDWYTDGWPDAQGVSDFWVPAAGILPTIAGAERGWVPDAATADAWLKWVTSPGTN